MEKNRAPTLFFEAAQKRKHNLFASPKPIAIQEVDYCAGHWHGLPQLPLSRLTIFSMVSLGLSNGFRNFATTAFASLKLRIQPTCPP